MVKARSSVENIRPYKPGKPTEELIREYGITSGVVKMASNENPLGPSPQAVSALSAAIGEANIYPDNSCRVLVEKLAELNEISFDSVLVGNGSVELILQAALAYAEPGQEVLMSEPSFIMYPIAAHIAGGKPVQIPVKGYVHDLEAMLEAVTDKTKIIYVDNPNNPLGSVIFREEMDNFISKVPEHVLVVIDEAYYEYVGSIDYPRSLRYVNQGHNVVVLRTFSKIYGLAGLRIGYGFAKPGIIEMLSKTRLPFSVNRPAQAAALAALADKKHVDQSRAANEQGKMYLTRELERLGLEYVPPYGNFILVRFPRDTSPVYQALQRRGIIVRPVGFADALRVTIGTGEQNRRLIKGLEEILPSL